MNETCFKITSRHSEEVPALLCRHEEADGHLPFHTAHAAQEGYQAVLICSEDTDVFIMPLVFISRQDWSSTIPEMWH